MTSRPVALIKCLNNQRSRSLVTCCNAVWNVLVTGASYWYLRINMMSSSCRHLMSFKPIWCWAQTNRTETRVTSIQPRGLWPFNGALILVSLEWHQCIDSVKFTWNLHQYQYLSDRPTDVLVWLYSVWRPAHFAVVKAYFWLQRLKYNIANSDNSLSHSALPETVWQLVQSPSNSLHTQIEEKPFIC